MGDSEELQGEESMDSEGIRRFEGDVDRRMGGIRRFEGGVNRRIGAVEGVDWMVEPIGGVEEELRSTWGSKHWIF